MNLRLPTDVYSPDQLSIVMLELNKLIAAQRDASVRAKVTPGGSDVSDFNPSALLLGVLHTAGVSVTDQQSLENLLVDVQTARDKAPVVHLVLTALPSRTFKRQLVEWFRQELHPQLLMSFAVRSDIGGGFLLRTGSRQYDFTYRTRLLANKKRISEIFDSVR